MTAGALGGKAIKVIGHTDPRGTAAYNERLGLQRAEKVKSFLVRNGIDPARVLTASMGAKDVAEAPKDRATDRRVPIPLAPRAGAMVDSLSVLFAAALVLLPACKREPHAAGSAPTAANVPKVIPGPSLSAGGSGMPHDSEPIPDARLAMAMAESIARDPVLRSEPIHVSFANGEAALTGTVRTLARKWRAERLVAGFKGAASVTNGILVKTLARPDPEIAREVDDAMKSDPATHNASVLANVNAARVTLRGTADSYSQRDLMAEIASRVRGVRAVSLEVAISPISSRGAAEIATEVTDALREDARLDGTQVAVDVHAKEVVLSGVVGSLAQRGAAVEDAWDAAVANVDASALRIDWRESEQARSAARPPPPSDKALAAAVSRRLSSDVRVGAELPVVHVERGVVSLSGNVVDFRAKRAAERDARRVSGVWRVEDGMTVPPAKRESDATIQQQVLSGIYDNVAAPDSRGVRVMTANARVTLQGAVASPEDKKAIEDDVQEVPGVVAVDDALQVRGYGPQTVAAAPESIRHRVIEEIFWDPRVATGQITVDVNPRGDATLRGQLDSWEEARAANDDAIRAGAATVINLILVEDSGLAR